MAGATLTAAQADALRGAAANEGGAMMGFMGMGMAQQAGGMNAQNLYAMGQEQKKEENKNQISLENSQDSWSCSCGTENKGKFCMNCGKKKLVSAEWICGCGAKNKGKFCSECGKPKPEEIKCKNCGWESKDLKNSPKFCPECGNKF